MANNIEIEKLYKYWNLINKFLSNGITVNEFENEFLKFNRVETFMFSDDTAKILAILFSDVDAFFDNNDSIVEESLNNPPFEIIDEQQLRNRAAIAKENIERAYPDIYKLAS